MAASGSVFSKTLNEITVTKLEELSRRRLAFESTKALALKATDAQGDDVIPRLVALSDGAKKCFGLKGHDLAGMGIGTTLNNIETELKNLDRFIAQASNDPSISPTTLAKWEQHLRGHLDKQSLKYEYASLCAKLVNEWLSDDSNRDGEDDVDMEESGFEAVDNAARLEAKINWEKSAFQPASVDISQLQSYLGALFGIPAHGKLKAESKSQPVYKALKELREQVEEHERAFQLSNQFNHTSLTWTIKGLLASDLLSNEKREVLRDFVGNPMILAEIADVLNMRMATLETWSWGPDGVAVEQRRKISGVYNMTMHEDLLQAIFLQYIGVKWSIFFKTALKKSFYLRHGVWKKSRSQVNRDARRRLGYYLGSTVKMWPSLQTTRRRIYRKGYTLSQLMEYENQTSEDLDGEEEVEYAQFDDGRKRTVAPRRQLASKAARKSAPSTTGQGKGLGRGGAKRHRKIMGAAHFSYEDDSDGNASARDDSDTEDDIPKSRMQLKQKLLHLLSAEIALINIQSPAGHVGELTAIHSSFDDWNMMLPHETVRTVLSFFRVSENWLGFFSRFLQAPIRLIGDDGPGTTQLRRRGTPASHVLSDVFGEVVLFCLDLAINQSTAGKQLWRVFDDFWFWSREHEVAAGAWKTIQTFAKVTGTSINLDKTGTVRISSTPDTILELDKSLPNGQIRWGFLQLSPRTGRFEIDQVMVDHHINELRFQLQSAKNKRSIFAFIQTWNAYAATFFTSNFGKPANCFGRAHVDQMLATHERIQREVFAGVGDGAASSVVSHIKKTLQQRSGITNVPDGFLFFPVELGGLELRSTFIPLLLIRDSVLESWSKPLQKLAESEQDAYQRAKTAFLNGTIVRYRESLPEPDCDWVPETQEERKNFMSFEEYTRYREEFQFEDLDSSPDYDVNDMFGELMESPSQKGLGLDSVRIAPALEKLKSQAGLQAIQGDVRRMDLYWSWITMMYGPEVVDRFGGLNIVDPGLLPMGMVSLLRERKVTWQE